MKETLARRDLVEAAASAFRSREPGGRIRAHPAWFDLDDAGRLEAFDAARLSRLLEAALDSRGLSTTSRAVLTRIGAARSRGPGAR